jgi:quercetin 2,3-dioxygenase
MLDIRKGTERGYADHGWLRSYHSFSFADYYDPNHTSFGPLRVINEDRVAPGQGFGAHSHRDMEILSYVLEGELAHEDSLGNGSPIRPGEVQRMSAGRGVTHSEFNHSRDRPVHFLQIWIQPNVLGIAPGYEQKAFPEEEKRGRLRLIASPDGRERSVIIHQDARLYAGLFEGTEQVTYALTPGRRGYVHVVRGAITVNGERLSGGDAMKLTDEPQARLSEGERAEIILFDLP